MKDIGRLKREIEMRRKRWLALAAMIVSAQVSGLLGSLPFYLMMSWWGVATGTRQIFAAFIFFSSSHCFQAWRLP